jgi:aminoglycoside phosphotransferase (APT) family kinase protein
MKAAEVLVPGPVSDELARRVRAVAGAGEDLRCRVVDRRVTPGERSHVLFEVGRRYVVGSASGDLSDLTLSPIESDESLPGLRLVHDPEALRSLTDSWFPAPPAAHCRAELLRYRPGRRATFLVETTAVGPDRRLVRRRLIAKVYHDPAKARAVHTEMAALATADTGPDLVLARPFGIEPEWGIVGQEVMAGTALGPLLAASSPRADEAIDRAARALAALHRLPPASERRRALSATIDKLEVRTRRVAALHPEAGAPLVELVDRLADASDHPAVGPARDSLVHGDAKADQFLVRPDRLALLDLDHCGVGDPAADVADFIGKLHQRSLASGRPHRATAEAMGRRFRAAYAVAGRGQELGEGFGDRITLHLAAGLARRALRALQRAPASPLAGTLAAEGHRHLDQLLAGGDRSR